MTRPHQNAGAALRWGSR